MNNKAELINKNVILDKKDNFYIKFISVVVFLSLISQASIFVESGIVSVISTSIWFIAFAVGLYKTHGKIIIDNFTFVCLFLVAAIFLLSLVDVSYIETRILRQLVIAVFVYLTSKLFDVKDRDKLFLSLAKSYFFACTILCIDTYLVYLMGGSFNEEGLYAYGSKNSLGIILLTALIFLYTFILNKTTSKNKKAVYIIISIFMMYVVVIMASRAALVSALAVLLYSLIIAKIPFKTKLIILGLSTILILIIVLNPELQEQILNIIKANRDSDDLSDISSGRTDEWKKFFNTFYNYLIIGYGEYKIESFPLSVLYQYGMILGGLFIGLAFYPLMVCKKYRKTKHCDKRILLCCILIFIACIVNSIFEELAPFGPGVKCFALWFLCGLFTVKPKKQLCVAQEDKLIDKNAIFKKENEVNE